MKKEMLEALRLTREGRLAEAKTVIERALGARYTSRPKPGSGTRGHVVQAPQLATEPAQSTSATSTAPAEVESNVQNRAVPPIITEPPPRPNFPPTQFESMRGSAGDLLAKLAARRPPRRLIPAEAIAPAAGRWITGIYNSQAGTRGYKLYIASKAEGRSLPLLVMLHGCTQDAEDFAAGTRMNFLAETGEFLVVFPEQTAAANTSRCWNWFQTQHQRRDRGEPSLIAGISRQIVAEYHADVARIYVAGLSAGGAMAAIMAASYPDLYAAVAVHSGLAPGCAHDLPSALQAMQQGRPGIDSADLTRTTPLILFQGDHDSTVHPHNADELLRQWTSGFGEVSRTVRQGQVPGGRAYTCERYQDSSGRLIVERWMVHGASHAWAGGSSYGSFTDPTGPNASGEFVRFFREHPAVYSTWTQS